MSAPGKDKDFPRPTGRARGRARATPMTQEQLDAVRMPGQRPPSSQASAVGGLQAGRGSVPEGGRGRGLTPDGGRGRGVTPEGGRGRGVTPSEGAGRGRGLTPDGTRGRARGVTPERHHDPELAGGRAHHRSGVTVSSGGGADLSSADSVASQVQQLALQGEANSGSSNGANGTSNGQGVGRGATRGRRERLVVPWTRPESMESKQGAGGEPIPISVNYFKLISKPDWRLLKYDVSMKPDQDNTRLRKALLFQHESELPPCIFDGRQLFTTRSDIKPGEPKVLVSKLRESGQEVTITIKMVEEIQPQDYHYMQFFNIVLRRCLEKMKLELVGRNYYDPQAKINLSKYKLELWPGYVTSIRQHEESILLCCEVSHKILRTDTVKEQMAAIISKNPNNYRPSCTKELLGTIVMTRYNNKTYRIDDILWDEKPTDTFESRQGKPMTFIDYYQEKYNRTIRDGNQPLLVSMPTVKEKRGGPSGPVKLIPELCHMTGLSDDQRADFNLMKAMGDYTRQDPAKRVQTLKGFSKSMEVPEIKEELDKWNLRFNEDLVKFRARLLAPETILGKGSSKFKYSSENADWGSAFRNWKQWSVVKLAKWAVIYPPKEKDNTQAFISSMMKVAPTLGMDMAKPKNFELNDNRPATYIQQVSQVLTMNPALVMIVIPNNRGDHYTAVKKKCCLENAVPSQVMTATVLGKPKGLMSVATKVALQINCKLGGEPWAVNIPLKNTMVIGYDTYHDSLHKGKSVGAVVASINETFTKFVSMADFHSNHSELTDRMCPAISKALRKYNEHNGCLPDRIIMYRDGVGDGQIQYVVDHEIDAIQRCFKEAGMENLKFTYIVVSKRINTRLFKDNGKPTNPPSGTVVDDVVTLPERYDFFLVSQSVRQGTVNPTSYNVLLDTSGLQPKHVQQLTYKLTHLYFNWPGTVRVPAVCQYAHKLALLVGDSLHQMPQEGLGDLLYYL